MPTLTIAEPLDINTIIWIGSVPEDEQCLSDRMTGKLKAQAGAGGFPIRVHEARDRQQLFDILDKVAKDAEQGLRPILHFDTHGNADMGVALEPSGDWASWPELIERLRAINIATGNNLVVVFGLCHGLHLYKFVQLKKAAPAYLFAAAEHAVSVKFLMDEVPEFYRQVQAQGAFLEPFKATLGKQMTLFNCQGLFLKTLAHYVKTQGRGAVLEARIDRTVEAHLEKAGIARPTAEDRADLVGKVRRTLEPSERLIEIFAPAFLIGRPPGFSYADVEAVAGPETPPPPV